MTQPNGSSDINPEPPEVLLLAYDLLLKRRSVDIVRPLQSASRKHEGKWEFAFELDVSASFQGLPPKVTLRAVIDDHFPLSTVDFYPDGAEPAGFPHQDAESGKLCLFDERLAPYDERRLHTFVDWAKQWIADAAAGKLVLPSDPYELPDFSRKLVTKPLPPSPQLYFVEDDASFGSWNDKLGRAGEVEFVVPRQIGVFPVRFSIDSADFYEPAFGSLIEKGRTRFKGRWILLPEIRVHRHRPAQTFGELHRLCTDVGIDLLKQMYESWSASAGAEHPAMVLIGVPIPATFGGKHIEVHWQPLLLAAPDTKKIKIDGFRPMTGGSVNHWNYLLQRNTFGDVTQLPWGKATNIAAGRLYARGAMAAQLRLSNVAIVGCGALGSAVAEMLARGGVGCKPHSLKLYDPQRFEIENTCRHTLDGTDLPLTKAEGLALRLSSACPLSTIEGVVASVPTSLSQIFSGANWVFDCTASEAAFEALNAEAAAKDVRLISLFLSFRAEFLTLAASGVDRTAKMALDELYSAIRSRAVAVDPDEYFSTPAKEELVLPGAGCWHPTFPATLGSVWLLASSAIDFISTKIAIRKTACAILVRRNLNARGTGAALLEVIWESPDA